MPSGRPALPDPALRADFESEHNFDDDDGDESEEEELSNRLMTDESTEAQDEPDNGDDTNIQNIQQHYHRQNNNKPMIVDNKSKVKAKEKMVHQQRNFQSEFNQLRTEKYQRDGEIFGSIVVSKLLFFLFEFFVSYVKEYNGQTLLDIHDAGDCGRFARTVLKNLFTPAEMSRSVLYSNSVYAKPSLDPIRTKKFKDKPIVFFIPS
ncbi:unnamed protein product [Rotaria sp. Silwood2]|nr:unnamed protein product [Rotaria sp. Silwood2]